MGRKVSDGQSVRVTVPENTTIVQGELVFLGGYLGMAARGVVTGAGKTASLILNVEPGEFETSQVVDDQAMAAGTDLFWDSATKKLSETPTAVYAGKVTVARDDNDVIWFKLAPQLPAAADAAQLAALIGDMGDLETTEKDTVVEAINEVKGQAGDLETAVGDVEDLDTTATDLVAAVNEVKTTADAALDTPAAYQADCDATEVAGVVADLNALLAKLQAAGLMAGSGD